MRKLFVSMIFLIPFFATSAMAATFTGTISGLPTPSLVESLTVFFGVSDDFALDEASFATGDAVPYVSPSDPNLIPWFSNESISSNTFEIELYNGDVLDFSKDFIYSQNNLLNGELFSFDILSGSVTSIERVLLGDAEGNTDLYQDRIATNLDSNGANISLVPLPTSILLLGAGFFGLIGIRKKHL